MLPPRVQLTSSAMLKSLEYAENAMEESALEYYENSNLVWRADFTDPTLACTSIGNEFQSRKYGSTEKSSRYSTNGDTDSENQQNGGSYLANRCRL